jgi:hypothetical protein
MKKKQTAVQWLSERLIDILGDKCNNLTQEQTLANHYAFKQALQMEREQIINSYISGDSMEGRANLIDAEQYYTQTFNQ